MGNVGVGSFDAGGVEACVPLAATVDALLLAPPLSTRHRRQGACRGKLSKFNLFKLQFLTVSLILVKFSSCCGMDGMRFLAKTSIVVKKEEKNTHINMQVL